MQFKNVPKEWENIIKAVVSNELSNRDDIIIEFKQSDIITDHAYHHWYGGTVATITINNHILNIVANGDVIMDLLKKKGPENERHICRIRDKSNQGSFYSTMSKYIKNDDELDDLLTDNHETYELNVIDSNWWECFTITSDNYEENIVLDSYTLYDAINECLEDIDNIIYL